MGHVVQREHPQNWCGIGVGSLGSANKPAISPKRCKIGPRLLLWTNRKSYTHFRLVPESVILNNLERHIQELPKVFKYALLSEERVKLRPSNLAGTFTLHRVYPNKRLLKIVRKRVRGHIQGLPKVLKYPLLCQAWVKLRTSNLAV